MDNWKNNSGLSLIGVLVAVTLLASSVLFISRLLVNRSDVVDISRQTFIATNLSREGLELVRALRDTNWFQTQDWVTGLCTGEAVYHIDAKRVREEQGSLISQDDQLYKNQAEEYVHDPSEQPTPYHRTIELDCSAATAAPAFITVTSTVRWDRQEQEKQVVITEKLFNWLPPT